jgi:septal ring-binding cell division protein DamX
MDTTELQARIPQMKHLLPSQQEWLERLLFQLAFNDQDRIYIVGTAGSGKSTVALAIAELFSEQYNIALLDASIEESQVGAQLMQQWFAQSVQPEVPLAQQVVVGDGQLPLMLLIDDADRYSAELIQQLETLPCMQFYFGLSGPANGALTLTLNRITPADAAQLLQHEALNSIALSERQASANGNIHQLLRPIPAELEYNVAPPLLSNLPITRFIAIAATALVLVMLAYFFWPAQDKPRRVTSQPVQPQVEVVAAPAAVDAVTVSEEPEAAEALDNVEVAEVMVDAQLEDSSVPEEAVSLDTQIEDNLIAEAVVKQTLSTVSHEIQNPIDKETENLPASDALPEEPVSSAAEADYQYDENQLLNMPKQQVAVQLAVLSTKGALQRFKKTYPELATIAYQRNWRGKMQLVLLLAPFNDSAAAKVQLRQLPDALRATGPFIKALKAVHTEIKARQDSQHNSAPE